MSDSRIYREWSGMKARCHCSNDKKYKHYGGRGISVCDEWKESFEVFMKWSLENGYTDNLTLDRINVNGNYEPGNCRWITHKEQMNNTRSNRFIEFNGTTMTLSQWSKKTGIGVSTIHARLKSGCSVEDALTRQVAKDKRIIYEG
jgi:hypothetical protein